MEALCDFANLHQAWQTAQRGKGSRADVSAFSLRAESTLWDLQARLLEGRWQPSGYRQFTIYERKPRIICAAPFVDRIVHHALMQRTTPLLDTALHPHCYACRPGKGVHRAVSQYQRWARRYPYALQLDIRQYFPSINHELLCTKLRSLLPDERIRALAEQIVRSTPSNLGRDFLLQGEDLVQFSQRQVGLPIGNLTSQHWANLYLAELDHFIGESLFCKAYLRYVDDMTLLADDKAELWRWRDAIEKFLAALGLMLHPRKQRLTPTRCGINLLGYRVFPDYVRLRKDAGFRYRRRLCQLAQQYYRGLLDQHDIKQSIAAWVGHGHLTQQKGLQQKVVSGVLFKRGKMSERESACVAWWLLEQQTEQLAFGQPQQEHHR